jgi:hypothetical protein
VLSERIITSSSPIGLDAEWSILPVLDLKIRRPMAVIHLFGQYPLARLHNQFSSKPEKAKT